MSVSINKATPDDIPFMAEQISAGAMEGHFDPRLATAAGMLLIREDVRSVVESQRRHDDPSLGAHGFVFREHGQTLGFAVVSDTPPELAGKELYAYYIAPEHRRKGHGRALLERIKQRVTDNGESLFVRCLPGSQRMYELLVDMGFACVGENEIGARILHHPPVSRSRDEISREQNRR